MSELFPTATVEDLRDLRYDGDTVELADGRTIRIRFQQDDAPVEDLMGDSYGGIAWVKSDRYSGYDHRERPEGFNGNAEILSLRDGSVWWQPYPGAPKRGTPEFDHLRRTVSSILEYGFMGVILEALDADGEPVETASVWCIEPEPDRDALTEIVTELAAELELV